MKSIFKNITYTVSSLYKLIVSTIDHYQDPVSQFQVLAPVFDCLNF